MEVLDFHHVDPSTKEFDFTKGQTYSYERQKREAEKCILICANCHRELHAGLWTLDR
jgi:hypothetical protein